MGEDLEVNLFSSENDPWEIYFSYGDMFGIVYATKDDAWEKRDRMKKDLETEYRKSKRPKPSDDFMDYFVRKYDAHPPFDLI